MVGVEVASSLGFYQPVVVGCLVVVWRQLDWGCKL